MFFLCLLSFLLLIVIFELTGLGFKRIFNIRYKQFNLITGYLLVIIFISLFSYKIIPLIFVGILVILGIKKLDLKKDLFFLILASLYLFHFLSLAFVSHGEVVNYFHELNQKMNLTPYQAFTVYLSENLKLNITVFTINILTSLNIFIGLSTTFEVLSLLFKKKSETHIAFLLYLFFFTILNSVNYLIFPYNAYQFVYYPFAGLTIYLLGLIPLQFGLFLIRDTKTLPLLLLINFGSVYFYQDILLFQVLLNSSFLFVLIFSKETDLSYLKFYPLVTLIPLFIQFSLLKYPNIYIMIMLFIILFFIGTIIIISKDPHPNRKLFTNLYLLGLVISLLVLISLDYLEFMKRIVTLFNQITTDKKLGLLILSFYGFTLYSMLKMVNTKGKLKDFLLIYPLILLILYSNFSFIYSYFFIAGFPFIYLIIYVYIKKLVLLERVIVFLITIWVGSSIFSGIPYLHQTTQNVYYRVSNDTLMVSEYLKEHPEIKRILVCDNIKDQIKMVTSKEVIYDELLEYTVNDKIPFDALYVMEKMEEYEIDAVILDKDKLVKEDFALLSEDIISFPYYIIYRY